MLAAAVDQEVGALPFLQVVLGPQPGPVEARVEAAHPRRGADEPIDQSTRNTSCEIKIHFCSGEFFGNILGCREVRKLEGGDETTNS